MRTDYKALEIISHGSFWDKVPTLPDDALAAVALLARGLETKHGQEPRVETPRPRRRRERNQG